MPVRCELALALVALVDELMKLLLKLPDCGLYLALLGLVPLVLVVHGLPPVSYQLPSGTAVGASTKTQGEHTSLWRVCSLAPPGGK